MPVSAIKEFLKLESASGILLLGSAALALIVANSPLVQYYDLLLATPMAVSVGDFAIDKPLLLWVNDGLMALFFLLVGLEIKREVLEGQLSSASQVALPLAGAVGGLAVPAGIYAWLNRANPDALAGWAIPAATDIAFALGIMALLGNRIPNALKLMLLAIAIFDDLGAVIIIALFYTSNLSLNALLAAGVGLVALFVMNRRRVSTITPYLFVGLIVWICVLKSGVHATLAGVAVALFVPIAIPGHAGSPAKSLEHDLHPWIAYAVVPVFAFFNAGVTLDGVTADALTHPITLGIVLGLVVGKQIGIMGSLGLMVATGLARLPDGLRWAQIYGMALLCGIGFTMSLFIASLAFQETGNDTFVFDRLGILMGSGISAVAGYLVLRLVSKPDPANNE
ncbi:MAG: Na+/H+ antiporter NhaA [Pseudomonadota bacterium]